MVLHPPAAAATAKKQTAYAVFQGGGVKGAAFAGALRRFEEEGITFGAVAGTSAGAIVAALYAAGYSAAELENALSSKDFMEFLDGHAKLPPRILRKRWTRLGRWAALLWPWSWLWQAYRRLNRCLGLYEGAAFEQWLRNLIERKKAVLDKAQKATFGSIKKARGVELSVVATDIGRARVEVYDCEESAGKEVAEAVRASMSIPLYFKPISVGLNRIVDGGLVSNFPVWVYSDKNDGPVYGFRFVQEGALRSSDSLFEYFFLLYEAALGGAQYLQSNRIQTLQTVDIDPGNCSFIDFDLSDIDKRKLAWSGYTAADLFLWRRTTDSPEQFLERIRKQAGYFLPEGVLASAGLRLNLMKPVGSKLKIFASHGMDGSADSAIQLELDPPEGCAGACFASRAPTQTDDVRRGLEASNEGLLGGELRSIISAPIWRDVDQKHSPDFILNIDSTLPLKNSPFMDDQFINTLGRYCREAGQRVSWGT